MKVTIAGKIGNFSLATSDQIIILAWEFVTQSCLKLQNPCSNHEIHRLFEHGFYLKSLNRALICMHDVTRENAAAVTDRFVDAFVGENFAGIYEVVPT